MKMNYDELNELYSYIEQNVNDEELVSKLGKSINLIDECHKTDQDVVVDVDFSINNVLVYINFDKRWPRFLIEEINNEYSSFKISTAYDDYVKLQVKYENNN